MIQSVRIWIIEVIPTSQALQWYSFYHGFSSPRAVRIDRCSVALSSFSLVIKHTVKERSCLPLCSVPVLSINGISFSSETWWLSASSEWSLLVPKPEDCQDRRRQNPVSLYTVYLYDCKDDAMPLFWPGVALDSTSSWQNCQRHWVKFQFMTPFLHSIHSTSTGFLCKVI